MFGIGIQELLVILVVALVVLGPQRLPEVARALGKGLGELRRAANGLTDELRDATSSLENESRELRRLTTPMESQPRRAPASRIVARRDAAPEDAAAADAADAADAAAGAPQRAPAADD